MSLMLIFLLHTVSLLVPFPPLSNPLPLSRLTVIFNGVLPCSPNSWLWHKITLGLSLTYPPVIGPLDASGSIKSSTIPMGLSSAIKLALSLRVLLNVKASTTKRLSLLLPNSSLFVVSWPWLLFAIGLSTKWTFKMLSSMGTLGKKFICSCLQVFLGRGRTMYADSTSPSMDLNKPLAAGFKNFLRHTPSWISTIQG